MPYVNIQVTREGVTREQKRELIAGTTELLQRVLNKTPATTHVVIDEIELDNWGVGGLPALEFRQRAAAASGEAGTAVATARPEHGAANAAVAIGAAGAAPEFDAVAAVVQLYFDGLYHSDTARLRDVFHPEAHYFCATEGSLLHLDMGAYFPVVDKRPSPESRGLARRDRIVAIEFAGPGTAFVKAECAIAPKFFTDFLTLVKLDGRWQIVAKVFHYVVEEQ